ncbi:alanine racemase [Flammeovirga yaeyamensis]|uniref:Alanine racemase n=1 Tax=Flammeovirga yaeyamensis TaxID=367791 RepID=A0AAX1N903_9BACT|nr:alanine racemase [Flammeovirga yaeyamensis]MBB3699565.1 D-serine deaminase-like pyridoxal phosphate-dependent protein [Flammeovirga yaeyamensis]NMF35180.1 DSD1 family PLP-dependent enzyme [Flammeovirga yaeyamensis]QWG04044.1 alanine racemase [Flammeovirga yaeyamensis]
MGLENNYFELLNSILKEGNRAIPFLMLDLDRIDENIQLLQKELKTEAHLRIVVKSLPSYPLIAYIANKLQTNRYMVFHQPFLSDLASKLDHQADILIGKPMPVKTAAYFYKYISKNNPDFNPFTQIQWLIDTKERALQYLQLAEKLGQSLRLNLEIDIGLHRGGFHSFDALNETLTLISEHSDKIEFSGFMGYDPHVVKIPSVIRSQKTSLKRSNEFYEECKTLVCEKFPQLWKDHLTFNGAGSPTASLHNSASSPLNDIAAGSCFVKPTTFDIPTLHNYQPACFIAAPVLKKMKGTAIPGLEKLKKFMPFINKKNAQSFFIYGGYWKADYIYPEQLEENKLYGVSTNQTMVNAPKNTNLEVDDFVFLRPHQSEFVFLQFGKLVIIKNQKIVDEWELMNNN